VRSLIFKILLFVARVDEKTFVQRTSCPHRARFARPKDRRRRCALEKLSQSYRRTSRSLRRIRYLLFFFVGRRVPEPCTLRARRNDINRSIAIRLPEQRHEHLIANRVCRAGAGFIAHQVRI
jgi:hypothetical protein